MDEKLLLAEFFEAENSRKWEKYRTYLHPDVEWTLFTSDSRQSLFGIDAYMERITSAYAGSDVLFSCRQMIESADNKRIATVLENTLGEISVDIFEFKDGLIVSEHEYLIGIPSSVFNNI